LEDLGVDGSMKMYLKDIGWGGGGGNWGYLTQDVDKWQASVNMVMKVWVP
jgi:hypothetical protein